MFLCNGPDEFCAQCDQIQCLYVNLFPWILSQTFFSAMALIKIIAPSDTEVVVCM